MSSSKVLPVALSSDVAPVPSTSEDPPVGFFVYGTFPIFLVRYLAEWTGFTGYDQVHLLGRAVSASFDLLSIGIVFFLGERLYNRKVGLLGALFSALSVVKIPIEALCRTNHLSAALEE